MAKSIEQVIAELRVKPGINVYRQQPGYEIMAEAGNDVYMMVIKNADLGLLSITSTDPRLAKPTLGRLVKSSYDREGRVSIEGWIGKSLRMHLQFQNGTLVTAPVISASVNTDQWSFDVF